MAEPTVDEPFVVDAIEPMAQVIVDKATDRILGYGYRLGIEDPDVQEVIDVPASEFGKFDTEQESVFTLNRTLVQIVAVKVPEAEIAARDSVIQTEREIRQAEQTVVRRRQLAADLAVLGIVVPNQP